MNNRQSTHKSAVIPVILLALMATACGSGSSTDEASNSASTTTTTAAPTAAPTTTSAPTTTTEAATTTTAVPPTTTVATTTTAAPAATVVDGTDACAVAQQWFAVTAAGDTVAIWDLIHSNSRIGPPLDEGTGGYQQLSEVLVDEFATIWGPWATADTLECSLHSLGEAYGEEVGVLALTGTVTIETTKTLTFGLPVRRHDGGWLIDPFYANAFTDLTQPAAQNLVLAAVPVEPTTEVVIDSTLLLGALNSVIVVDGTEQSLVFSEHPTNFDLVQAKFSPDAPWSPGTHWVVAALMADNGTVSVAYDRFTVG